MTSSRSIDAGEIIKTVDRLHKRIGERFPHSGLAGVAEEVLQVVQENTQRVKRIRRPDPLLRAVILFILVGAGALAIVIAVTLNTGRLSWTPTSGSELISEVEASIGIVVFLGAAIVYLLSLETRVKRGRALQAIHELRSLAHIVDMHQLTKDPERSVGVGTDTASSPKRTLSPFQLSRYLDYCSELLALIAKVGALYAQSLEDPVAISAVDEIENLTNGLSRKIWQKIMILDRMEEKTDAIVPPEPPPTATG